MKSLKTVLAATLLGVVATAAPIMAQSASIDYDHSVNFLKFKTYTWQKVHATDPAIEGRITIALNRDMAGRYMTEVSNNGDITITAVEATQDKQEISTFYSALNDYSWQRPWCGSGFMDAQASPQDVPLNTLIIDMYDSKTHKLLWRGTITEPAGDNQDKNAQKIDKAVTELISKYPPKFKKS